MTAEQRFERALPTMLDDLYLGPMPEYRDELLAQAARTAQRPAWTFPGRWIPMADLVTERTSAPRVPWRPIAVALIILALLIAGAVAYVGSQQPKLPPPFGVAHNGLIAFQQSGDIVALDPTTATTKVLVGGPGQDSAPLYSNDGTTFAFERTEPTGGVALYVADADGSQPVRVTPDRIDDILARSFSPDGQNLLVTAWTGGRAQMFEVAVDGSRPPRTLDVLLPTDKDSVEAPAYRPTDGSQVLVMEWLPLASSRSLSLIDIDARTVLTLIPPSSTSDLVGATWSPDGQWIAYGKFDPNAAGFSAREHVMRADGSDDHLVDTAPGIRHGSGEVWSNDSTRLVVDRGYAADFSNERTEVVNVVSGAAVELQCPALGGGTCGDSWMWSPDDASLLGIINGDQPTARYVMADPATGQVTELAWPGSGEGSWQRVGP